MSTGKTRAHILELCSESEYAAWEFWLTEPEHRTVAEAECIVQSLAALITEGKLRATEHACVEDGTLKEVQIDPARLRDQVLASMKLDFSDPGSTYWFWATEDGQKEDRRLRTRAP